MSRVPAVVARTELRRTIRVVAGDRTKLLVVAALALFALGPFTFFGALLLRAGGRELAAGGVDLGGFASVTEIATGATALVWLFLVGMATIRTVTTAGDLDRPACLLISTRLRNVVVGVIGAEAALLAIWLLPPTVVLSGAFASGTGSALPVVAAVATVAVCLATAVPVGFVLGIAIRHLLTVYEPIARYRTVLLVAASIAYVGAIATGWFDALVEVLFRALAGSPLGWPGHILFVGVPTVSPAPLPIVGAVVGAVVVGALALAAGTRAADVHWYADPARVDGGGAAETRSSRRLEDALSVGLSRPARTVAATAIRRTKRAPVRLLYAAYPIFGAFFFVQEIARAGTVPAYVAVLLCTYVVWGAGALFTLNPLGDRGRALPAVLTSTVPGRDAIGGLVVAGAAVAVPVAVLVSIVAGLASPLSIGRVGLLLAGTVVGAVASPALAVGVGTAFPRFGSVRVTSNCEAVMPSKTAFLVYTLAIAAPAVAAVVAFADGAPDLLAGVLSALVSILPGIDLAVPAGAVAAAALVVLSAGLVAPLVSYRYAVGRFDDYTLE